jgi:hypothetical protein
MKVSDLILALQEFYQEHGEMEVMARVERSTPGEGMLRGALRRTTGVVARGTIISSGPEDQPICVVEVRR